jgi:hypothetical protein
MSWQRSETRTEYSKHGDRLIVLHFAIEDAWALAPARVSLQLLSLPVAGRSFI